MQVIIGHRFGAFNFSSSYLIQVDWKANVTASLGGPTVSKRSPDGAQRNPGSHLVVFIPDFAALHPGYGVATTLSVISRFRHSGMRRLAQTRNPYCGISLVAVDSGLAHCARAPE
jgi:hypothetical protein